MCVMVTKVGGATWDEARGMTRRQRQAYITVHNEIEKNYADEVERRRAAERAKGVRARR